MSAPLFFSIVRIVDFCFASLKVLQYFRYLISFNMVCGWLSILFLLFFSFSRTFFFFSVDSTLELVDFLSWTIDNPIIH